MDQKIKHMELIQGVINRLATNSFQMKGWSVVLVAAILVLLARENKLYAAYIALAPILVFWALDGYFLWQERLPRPLRPRAHLGRRPSGLLHERRTVQGRLRPELGRHRTLKNALGLLRGVDRHGQPCYDPSE